MPLPHGLSLTFLVLTFLCAAQERTLLVTTGGTYSAIGLEVGINSRGAIGFTANDTLGSAAFAVDPNGTVLRHTFQSATRTFGPAVSINDQIPPQIAVRDRVSGSPPAFLMRRWNANATTTFTIVGNSAGGDYDSASFRADINSSAVMTFSALVAGSTATELLAGSSQGSLTTLATFPTVTSFYPQISDDNVIVIRDTANRIVTYKYPLVGTDEIIAGSGYTEVGRAPGIAASSDTIAYSGNRSSGDGVFVALKGSSGRNIFRLAGEGADLLTDVDLDSRVGVTATGSLARGLYIAVVFSGTFNSTQGVYAVGARAVEINRAITFSAGPPVMIAPVNVPLAMKTTAGDSITKTISQCTLYDPINTRRQIAFGALFTDGSSGIIRVDPCAVHQIPAPAYKPHKQFEVSGYLVDNMESSGTFTNYGCAISSFATAIDKVSRAAGLPIPSLEPRPLQQWLRSQGMQDDDGKITFGNVRYEAPLLGGAQQLRVATIRPTGTAQFSFDEVIFELTNSRPVILGVPSLSSKSTIDAYVSSNKLHYVAAVEYDAGLGMLYGRPSGILINDPGFGDSYYGSRSGGYADVPPETGTTPNYTRIKFVTLQDYFAVLSRKGGVGTAAAQQLKADYLSCEGDDIVRDALRIEEWFKDGVIYRRGTMAAATIPQEKRQKLITKVQTTINTSLPIVGPSLQINSPVELVVTDAVTGQRYVTSSAFLLTGDILLEKYLVDQPASVDEDDAEMIDPRFPHYTISLPASTYGHSLNVQVNGIGNGSYKILYQQTGTDYKLPPSISGSITNGQQTSAVFTLISSAPPVKITQFTKTASNQFLIRWETPSTITIQFSENLLESSWQNLQQVAATNSWTGRFPANSDNGFFRLIAN
jgi:hypothetical protein